MIEKINELLNEKINCDGVIYALKGFNSIIRDIDMPCEHIFDLRIDESLENILIIKPKDFFTQNIGKLSELKKFYCLYEELIYLEANNLYGIIEMNNYKIEIIDIGCFDYMYPGLIARDNESVLNLFDEDSPDGNILQTLYSEMTIRNNELIISYNEIDSLDKCTYTNLIDRYSEDYCYHNMDNIKSIEISDNATSEIIIQTFNIIAYSNINTVIYTIIEGKNNTYVKKLLYLLNSVRINIVSKTKEIEVEKPNRYNKYLSILKRINKDYDFFDISIYKDPFNSNEKKEVNQSVIIDIIYNNILKAQKGESFKDVFVTAPTGAGKSVLFQIPAIMAAEEENLVTIVISPLIGLMNDQVENIKKMTNCAATINSDYTPFEKETIKESIRNGVISILYISPESLLSNSDIKTFIGNRKIGLLVVDEAHTVATWGKNFRPDYWYLGDYLDKLRHSSEYIFPIATFTATATISDGTDDMYHDIIESLNMTCDTFIGNVRRKNIRFNINVCQKDHAYQEEKDSKAMTSIQNYINSNEKTLVYFPYVSKLQEYYNALPKDKVSAYFGSFDKYEKGASLSDLIMGNRKVVLATKAFGMGIDVKDIKNVYHFAPTGNLSDYVQEIGRAAREQSIQGIASTDYYEEDFRYINQLYGMSRITLYNIIGVLQKILYRYQQIGKRNFLLSTEEFAHVFNANNDDDIENRLKATIIAIKKDFKFISNYIPLIFKPRGMFTKGLFFIPDSKIELVKDYGWEKYFTLKYSREELKKLSSDKLNTVTSYLGDVYEFDFKKCWENNYNGKYDGISFGNFKRKFYEGELEGIDKSCFLERMILTLECKHGKNFRSACNKCFYELDLLKETFDDMKMSKKHYRIDEMTNLMCSKGKDLNKTRINNIMEPLINMLISYNRNVNGNTQFLQYNSSTGRYHIVSAYYNRVFMQIRNAIEKHLEEYFDENTRISIVDVSKTNNQTMRKDPLLIGAQVMELFDTITYRFESGNKPEFFVRVNSEKAIRKVLEDKSYVSKTLNSIQKLHYDSVRYMKYFFAELKDDVSRWDFIEDYFLGHMDEYHIEGEIWTGIKKLDDEDKDVEEPLSYAKKSIKVYHVFNTEDEIIEKYYISKTNIDKLDSGGCIRITADCLVAQELLKSDPNEVFVINGYEYMLEKIENCEIE